jgi:hypothetical protein
MLPKTDLEYLESKGMIYELHPQSSGEQLLVLKDVRVSADRFDRRQVDMLFKVPVGHPISALDMFWVHPVIRLVDGNLPQSADQFENYLDRTWQRFSRHVPTWRPGADSLRTFVPLVLREFH